MLIKVYYENNEKTMGGYEIVSIFTLFWWLLFGKINPHNKTDIYYIRKLETITGKRI